MGRQVGTGGVGDVRIGHRRGHSGESVSPVAATLLADGRSAWISGFLSGAPELDGAEVARLGQVLAYIQSSVR